MLKPLLAPLLLILATSRLTAQSTVSGVRDLGFGAAIRGVQTSVSPNDPGKSGRFYIRHALSRQVRLQFTLPTQLARVSGGGSLPISFQTTSAVARGTATNSLPVTFNPNTPITFTLTTSADFFVNLGGRVSPAMGQATGSYTGTVVLTCTFF